MLWSFTHNLFNSNTLSLYFSPQTPIHKLGDAGTPNVHIPISSELKYNPNAY